MLQNVEFLWFQNFGLCFSLYIYMNVLPPYLQPFTLSQSLLFADDINIIISHEDVDYFRNYVNDDVANLNK